MKKLTEPQTYNAAPKLIQQDQGLEVAPPERANDCSDQGAKSNGVRLVGVLSACLCQQGDKAGAEKSSQKDGTWIGFLRSKAFWVGPYL